MTELLGRLSDVELDALVSGLQALVAAAARIADKSEAPA
jgi:hypothetical protein